MEMEIVNCRNCGRELNPNEAQGNILECPSCGTHLVLPQPSTPREAVVFLGLGEHNLTLQKFNEAATAYSRAVALAPGEPEAYWGLGLAATRVAYVQNQKEKTLTPKTDAVLGPYLADDENCQTALALAVGAQKAEYQRRIAEIDSYKRDIQKKADKGDPEALFLVAECYYRGRGVAQNQKKAVSYYEKAAQKGNAPAQNKMGFFYRFSDLVRDDVKQAFKWYEMAAKQGYAPAQMQLGDCYECGVGTKLDWETAEKWYQRAADQGDTDAQTALEKLSEKLHVNTPEKFCENGQELEAFDKEVAAKWYEKAANKNYVPAFWALYNLYGNEFSDKANPALAFKWCQKAAEHGHAEAQYELGQLYENGRGVKENEKLAFQWYQKSADQGYAPAYSMVSYCYELGIGVEENEKLARKWRQKSDAAGVGD